MSDSETQEFRYPRLEPGMKPGDHPDFFKFPAPAGRSRESRIVLDRRGVFSNDGVAIEHAGMATAFASWIARHPDNGRYILTNRYDWTYFTVEDVPFFVKTVLNQGGMPQIVLSDGSLEPLDTATVRVGPENALYVMVKSGQFEAKFTPSAQLRLTEWIEEGEGGRPVLRVGGGEHPIRMRQPATG